MRCSLSATPLKDLKSPFPRVCVEAVIFLTCCKSAFPIDLIYSACAAVVSVSHCSPGASILIRNPFPGEWRCTS